jgi:hypothetical protein
MSNTSKSGLMFVLSTLDAFNLLTEGQLYTTAKENLISATLALLSPFSETLRR